MELGIRGKTALVLGGSAGIGKAIARALTSEGVKVAIAARSGDKLSAAQKEISAAMTIQCDLEEVGAAKNAVLQVASELGGLDILVTNTGGPPKAPLLDLSTMQWQVGIQTLLLSVLEATAAAHPIMARGKWGRVLMVTSSAAREPLPGLNISNTLRAGLLGLMKSASTEWAKDGITVNCLLPGYTATERLLEIGVDTARIQQSIPMGRLARPEELGSLAAFLASEHAGYLTGQAITLDGGAGKGY